MRTSHAGFFPDPFLEPWQLPWKPPVNCNLSRGNQVTSDPLQVKHPLAGTAQVPFRIYLLDGTCAGSLGPTTQQAPPFCWAKHAPRLRRRGLGDRNSDVFTAGVRPKAANGRGSSIPRLSYVVQHAQGWPSHIARLKLSVTKYWRRISERTTCAGAWQVLGKHTLFLPLKWSPEFAPRIPSLNQAGLGWQNSRVAATSPALASHLNDPHASTEGLSLSFGHLGRTRVASEYVEQAARLAWAVFEDSLLLTFRFPHFHLVHFGFPLYFWSCGPCKHPPGHSH